MNDIDRQIIAELKKRIPEDIRYHIKKLILFGSRARGDAGEDSDLDIIALVDEKNSEIENKLGDAAYSVMWDNDFRPVISLKVFAESRFQNAVERGFSFYRNVDEEGVVL